MIEACKWFGGERGCRRKDECSFSHDIIIFGIGYINTEQTEIKSYRCVSCHDAWKVSHFVVKHMVRNMEVFFCLNCEDWVRDKSKVLDNGWSWSLYDMDGNLDQFV